MLLDAGDYEKALFILENLREAGYRGGMPGMLETLIEQGQTALVVVERRREAAPDYEDILVLAARQAFAAWCGAYAEWVDELDSAALRDRFQTVPPPPPVFPSVVPPTPRSKVYDILPAPFEWVAIPAGVVTLETGGYVPESGQTFDLPTFSRASTQ